MYSEGDTENQEVVVAPLDVCDASGAEPGSVFCMKASDEIEADGVVVEFPGRAVADTKEMPLIVDESCIFGVLEGSRKALGWAAPEELDTRARDALVEGIDEMGSSSVDGAELELEGPAVLIVDVSLWRTDQGAGCGELTAVVSSST